MKGQRIKELRKAVNMTQMDFAKKIGINQKHLSQVENGVANISRHLLSAIAAEFGANKEWLEIGKGPMLKDAGSGLDRFSPAHKLLIERFTGYFAENVPISQTEKTIEVVHGLINILMSDNEEAKKAIGSSILVLNQAIRAGEDKKQNDETKGEVKKSKSNPRSSIKKTKTG